MTHDFHPTMLREYDIRGVVGDTLSVADATAIRSWIEPRGYRLMAEYGIGGGQLLRVFSSP